jgi:hypothetical protein
LAIADYGGTSFVKITPGPTNTSSPISIADVGSGFDKGMVAYAAIAPDDRSLHHMRKSPYASAGTNPFALAKREGWTKVGSGSIGDSSIG